MGTGSPCHDVSIEMKISPIKGKVMGGDLLDSLEHFSQIEKYHEIG